MKKTNETEKTMKDSCKCWLIKRIKESKTLEEAANWQLILFNIETSRTKRFLIR